jgi:NADPH-dependent F420 reductase
VIGFIGGTGPEGRGLAIRFALAGEQVMIGSRDRVRAREAAKGISALVATASVSGATNQEVASTADTVFIAVPYAGHRQAIEAVAAQLGGKVVVDVVAPLAFSDGVARAIPVAEGSAALEAQALLPNSAVAAAFHSISAHDLLVPDRSIDADVVVCADDPRAMEEVMGLAEKIRGIRPVDGGGLHNAGNVEHLAALLMNINRRYKTRSAIRILGI